MEYVASILVVLVGSGLYAAYLYRDSWIKSIVPESLRERIDRIAAPVGASLGKSVAKRRPVSAPRTSAVARASVAAGGLYSTTLVIECVSALARSLICFLGALILLIPLYIIIFAAKRDNYFGPLIDMWGNQTGQWGYDNLSWIADSTLNSLVIALVVGLLLGFWPILNSLFHTLFPVTRSGAGGIEFESLGAREPTREELGKIIDTLGVIESSTDGVPVAAPSAWLVLDEPTPDSYTIGSTVYLARAAIESEYLAGIMAHEMGHVAHKDGDLLLALRRFIIPLAYFVGIDRHPLPSGAVLSTGSNLHQRIIRSEDEKIFFRFNALRIKFQLAFWFGGLGMFLMGRQWAQFWRQRDFLADDYAVQIGQGDSLMQVLTMYRHVDVAQPFLMTNRPYTAERLDRLRG